MSKRKEMALEEIAAELHQENEEEESDFDDSDVDPHYEPSFQGFSSDEDEDIDIEEAIKDMNIEEEDSNVEEEAEEDMSDDFPIWEECAGRNQHFPFTGRGGVNIDLPTDFTPFDAFSLFIDESILDLLVDETNLYARQRIEKGISTPKGRLHKWKASSRQEMKKFLGLMMWMGLLRAGEISDYWRASPLYKTSIPEMTMSRNRFQILLNCLHFADNTKIVNGDRLGKIQPLLDSLLRNFQTVFTPGCDVVIDETLVPWRGRLIFRQYIPNKAHKYGIKLFKLCSTEGYTYNISIYSGKSKDGTRTVGLAKSVCTKLMEKLLNEGRTLYVDNFYTSYELAKLFLAQKTHVVGTLRSKKKNMPKEVMDKSLRPGEVYAREDQHGIVVMKWRDKRDVRLLTTKHNADIEERQEADEELESGPSTRDADQRKRRKVVKKPIAIVDYNKGKCGIDISDQMSSYESPVRKGVKWYRKLALELITSTAVVNALIVYKQVTGKAMKIKKFREIITEYLLEIRTPTQRQPKKVKVTHMLKVNVDVNGRKTRRRCKMCYEKVMKEKGRKEARNKARNVYTFCVGCPEKPYLCHDCFENIHVTEN